VWRRPARTATAAEHLGNISSTELTHPGVHIKQVLLVHITQHTSGCRTQTQASRAAGLINNTAGCAVAPCSPLSAPPRRPALGRCCCCWLLLLGQLPLAPRHGSLQAAPGSSIRVPAVEGRCRLLLHSPRQQLLLKLPLLLHLPGRRVSPVPLANLQGLMRRQPGQWPQQLPAQHAQQDRVRAAQLNQRPGSTCRTRRRQCSAAE